MIELTEREWRVATFVERHMRDHHVAPTTREIAAHLGKASGEGITHTLDKLAEKGVIHRAPRKKWSRRERAIGIRRGVKIGFVPPVRIEP